MQERTTPSRSELVELIPRLRRFACALVGHAGDGDDLAQTTLERILSKGLPVDTDLVKWAFRVCRNIWIDDMRAKSVRIRLAPQIRDAMPTYEDGERTIMGRLEIKDVSKAIALLPEEQRAALALVTLEGHSYAEAAEILDVSPGTIMSRIHRARHKLVEVMTRTDAGDPAHVERPI